MVRTKHLCKLTVNEVDDEAFDMTSVVVLVSHNHEMTIAESLDVFLIIDNIGLQSHDIE